MYGTSSKALKFGVRPNASVFEPHAMAELAMMSLLMQLVCPAGTDDTSSESQADPAETCAEIGKSSKSPDPARSSSQAVQAHRKPADPASSKIPHSA